MNLLLRLARAIDALNQWVGRVLLWAIFASVLISAGNALVRKAFSISSNAWLEIQWYLFAWAFLGVAGYTLLHNEHVRIDVIVGRFSRRVQVWIDLVLLLLFFTPVVWMVLDYGWPFFLKAWNDHEMSSNAGGLIRWPVFLAMPVGFTLLALQGVSEFIKRAAYLMGRGPDPGIKAHEKTPEEELAEEIARQRELDSAAALAATAATNQSRGA